MKREERELAVRVLAHAEWMQGFAPVLAEALLAHGRLVRIRPGEWAQGEGDEDRGLFVVIDGVFHTYCTASGDRDVMIGVAGMGAVLGHATRFSGGPRLVTAICTEPGLLLQIPETALERIAERRPEIWRVIASSAYANLRRAMQMMVEAITLAPRQRIAARLIASAEPVDGSPAMVRLSQQALGEMTGLTRKTVNLHLAAFEREGLVSLRYGYLLLRDPGGLRRAAV
ncbi:putative Crp/Fnr family transcriptional regulator [Caenibius tardaugens NBRC 16725]|uniref:Putative Crp/Fnr family transcriptional regulator n=1 Tax=Caenibius tardaugens NBRC 16725 TaxID=1219035 RepID=U2YB71_9SPHN|nr:Crp/Fnr family transcriptional regulator [Caenibius tardaugens]AZI35734.1 Crp/Fnr family transcriptional regulator [Caenibius tardaugens NBRC 16725]GAD50711.1 putative Crp/Fnr family transcriptional regulator [Caenibius tardaugens NBRC 16725]